jgi:hypothetical protein
MALYSLVVTSVILKDRDPSPSSRGLSPEPPPPPQAVKNRMGMNWTIHGHTLKFFIRRSSIPGVHVGTKTVYLIIALGPMDSRVAFAEGRPESNGDRGIFSYLINTRYLRGEIKGRGRYPLPPP